MGRQEVGGRAAAPIWLYFAEKALQGTPVEVFPVPEGIVFVKVDPKTGAPAKPSDQGGDFRMLPRRDDARRRRDRSIPPACRTGPSSSTWTPTSRKPAGWLSKGVA